MKEYYVLLSGFVLMIGISAYFYRQLSRQPTLRVVIFLPLTGERAPEVTLRQTFFALTRLPYALSVTVVLLGGEESDELCRQREAFMHRYPAVDFVDAVSQPAWAGTEEEILNLLLHR